MAAVVACSKPAARSSLPSIKTQRRVSLHQFPIAPPFSEHFSPIKSLLVLRDHYAPLAQQFRLRQSWQRLRVLVLHRVGRIQKYEISNGARGFQLDRKSTRLNSSHLGISY